MSDSDWELSTRAVRTGHQRTVEGEHSEPIFTTSSFVFDSAEQAAARFAGTEAGNIYSRFSNPTVRVFEERLAALEVANVLWLQLQGCQQSSPVAVVCCQLEIISLHRERFLARRQYFFPNTLNVLVLKRPLFH